MAEPYVDRLKNAADRGLDSLDDAETLSLLLSYVKRGDPGVTARALLERFGCLEKVLEATVEELAGTPGMGESAAVLLNLIPRLGRRYMVSRSAPSDCSRLGKLGAYFVSVFLYECDEVVCALAADERYKLLSERELGRGVVNGVDVSVRKIANFAVKCGAKKIILSHNHPHGLAVPSAADISTTQAIFSALDTMGVELVDHIIVAGNDYYSMAKHGDLPVWRSPSVYKLS